MIAKLAMIATDMDYDEDGIGGGYEGIAESAALNAVRLREELGVRPGLYGAKV
jgi:hypothetical protein